METRLLRSLVVSGLALGAMAIGQGANADASDIVRWQTVVGIIQGNNVVGTGTGAVTGGPGPWSALGGHVKVDPITGHVDFGVNGLVFAGGNAIGGTGAVRQVKGTLVCDTDGSASGGSSVLVDTPLVELDDQGDARFNGNLGALPSVCSSEPDIAFLIRTGAGRWIANGAVLR